MISNLLIAIEAVAPMFIVMAVGYFIRSKKMLTAEEVKHVNKMVFSVFLPVLMFCNLYGADIKDAFDFRLIGYAVIMILAVFFTTMLVVKKIVKEDKTRGAMIQAIYRSNFVIMGIPIVSNIFGKGQLSLAAVAVTIVVPLFNVLAVFDLEMFRGGKATIGGVLKQIAKNPLILGAVAGIISIIINLQLPTFMEKAIYYINDVATPMALITLGASLNINAVKQNKKNLVISIIGKLIIVPAIVLPVAALLGFRGAAFVILIAIFASPTAVSSFAMAEQMDSDGDLAGSCVVFSSAISCLTLFGWIFLFKSLGMF